jgi:hypothetical protein
VNAQPDLMQVVGALVTRCRRPDFLHGRQQEAYEDGGDGDNNQEFDQRESSAWHPIPRYIQLGITSLL